MTSSGTDSPTISAATLDDVSRHASAIATKSVALMGEQLSWFRTLTAEQRSWVTLVAQAGISGYITWMREPATRSRVADAVFGSAPRELIRTVSLRRTVDLVRVAITVAEEEMPAIAKDAAERAALRDSLLRYSREIAFAAAAVYATAAETRGAWDARVEAAIVDGLVRGEDAGALASRASALNWDTASSVVVVVGNAPKERSGGWQARETDRAALSSIHGSMLVVVLSGPADPATAISDLFGDGVICYQAAEPGFDAAITATAEAISAYRAAPAWPAAPRLTPASALLPERALAGDASARAALQRAVFTRLAGAAGSLMQTVDAYLAHGASLEPTARHLFIHSNTLRYRLRRVSELTGYDPWSPRDRLALSVALILGRLSGHSSAPVLTG